MSKPLIPNTELRQIRLNALRLRYRLIDEALVHVEKEASTKKESDILALVCDILAVYDNCGGKKEYGESGATDEEYDFYGSPFGSYGASMRKISGGSSYHIIKTYESAKKLFQAVHQSVAKNDELGDSDVFLKSLLGRYYSSGIGVEVNTELATTILRSVSNYAPAAEILYYNYISLGIDDRETDELLIYSAQQGYQPAIKVLDSRFGGGVVWSGSIDPMLGNFLAAGERGGAMGFSDSFLSEARRFRFGTPKAEVFGEKPETAAASNLVSVLTRSDAAGRYRAAAVAPSPADKPPAAAPAKPVIDSTALIALLNRSK